VRGWSSGLRVAEWFTVLCLAGCAQSTPSSPTPSASFPASACRYVPDPGALSFDAAGGAGSAAVSTAAGCSWKVAVLPGAESWLVIQSQIPAPGPGSVRFTIEPNRSFSGRNGAFAIVNPNGEALATYAIGQRGAGCLYSVDPPAIALSWMGTYDGAGITPTAVHVRTEPADCHWTASSSVPWIKFGASGRLDSASGVGSESVYFTVLETFMGVAPRSGEVVIAGLSGVNPDARVTITQHPR
jgi:hypothetical protein